MGLTSQLNRRYRAMIARGEYPVCYLCGEKITKQNQISQDHLIPKALGGQTIEPNLVCSHKICNSKKGCLTVAQFFELKARQRI